MKLWAMLCRATQDGSWCRVLTKRSLLEKGMANHLNIVNYKLTLTKSIANDWTTKAFAICLYGDVPIPYSSVVKRICLQCRKPGFNLWVGKIPWRRKWQPTPVFWPGEFHGLCSPRGRKESDTTEWLSLSLSLSMEIEPHAAVAVDLQQSLREFRVEWGTLVGQLFR